MQECSLTVKHILEDKESLGCVMAILPPSLSRKITALGRSIPDREIDPAEGREDNPHVTVFYGITGEGTSGVVRAASDMDEFELSLGKLGLFRNDEHDVLYVEVEKNLDLEKMHERFRKLPNKETYPDYKPHATVAYLIKGNGNKYVDKVVGGTATIDKLVYSSPDHIRTTINLK